MDYAISQVLREGIIVVNEGPRARQATLWDLAMLVKMFLWSLSTTLL